MKHVLVLGALSLALLASALTPAASANYVPCTDFLPNFGQQEVKEIADFVTCDVVAPGIGFAVETAKGLLPCHGLPACLLP